MSWALDDFYTGHEKGSLSVVRNDMSKAPTKAQTSEKQEAESYAIKSDKNAHFIYTEERRD